MSKQRAAGFTIIELLVVMIIIALLAAIMVPVYINMTRQQKQSACMSNLRAIGIGLAQYYADNDNTYPAAPRPDYLQLMDQDATGAAAVLPFYDPTTVPPAGWVEWQQASATTVTTLGDLSGTGPFTLADTTGIVTAVDTGEILNPYVLFRNTKSGLAEVARVATVSGTAITLEAALVNTFPADRTRVEFSYWYRGGGAKVRVGNYGLATLYQLYQDDKNDYVNARTAYHCPAVLTTEEADRDTVRSLADDPKKRYDPLWGGYNTYDVTYNYDQYHNEILAYDYALGGEEMNLSRQLHNDQAPADTVVCWCYGHLPTQAPTAPIPDPATPDVRGDARQARQAEGARSREVTLVLWLDGTVGMMRPTLMRAQFNVAGKPAYYWVPPYLYTRGDSRP